MLARSGTAFFSRISAARIRVDHGAFSSRIHDAINSYRFQGVPRAQEGVS
jgi:hypothetical protein